jgi:hypothetical protein
MIRTSGEIRFDVTMPTALQLVDAVHRADRLDIARIVADADLPALAVVLAAMVDEDKPVSELLAWARDLRVRPAGARKGSKAPRLLQPCGTHAAYTRHRSRGEEPCEACVIGERLYQRNRPGKRAGARRAA